jgi:hypothetical protein
MKYPMEEQEKKPMAVPQYPPVYYYPEDEITLKELILKFLEYLQEFRRNLALIVLITAATAAIAIGYQQYKGYEYQTSLTYKLDQVTYFDGFNQLVPSFLNLDISTAKLTALTYENEFLGLLLEQKPNQGTTIQEQLIQNYGSQLSEEESKATYQLQSLLHRKEGKKELGLFTIGEDHLQVTTNDETLSFAIMDGVMQLFQQYIFQEILQKKKAATTYLTEQQSFVEAALQEQQELKKSMAAFAREEADKIILNYINQKNAIANQLNQLNLLNILEAPSVKVTQRTVTPEVIGTSLGKIIIISSILGLFLALGWVVVRKIVRDALS